MKKKIPGINRIKLQTKVHENSAMMLQGRQSSDEPASGVLCETQNLATYLLF